MGDHAKSLAGGQVPTNISRAKPVKSGFFLLGGPYLYSWTDGASTNVGYIITYLLSPLLNYKHIDNRDLMSPAPRRVIGAY